MLIAVQGYFVSVCGERGDDVRSIYRDLPDDEEDGCRVVAFEGR